MKDEILMKNAEVTLADLKQEIQKTVGELTSVFKEKEEVLSELDLLKKKITGKNEELQETTNRIIQERKSINSERNIYEKEKELRKEEITSLNKQKREADHLLSIANERAIKADDDFNERLDKVKEMDEEIARKSLLVEGILDLENEKISLEKKKEDLQAEISKEKEKFDLESLLAKDELANVKKNCEELLNSVADAEDKRNRYESEYLSKKDDLDIYYTRVKEVWDKVFPGKEMPMLK